MEFPVRSILAASSAAHRINNGFVKKYDDTDKKSNSSLLYSHFFQGQDLQIAETDYALADEIIDYLKGLGIKAMERDLTDFEKNVLRFITSKAAGKEQIGIAASLPKVYFNKVESDTWEDRERILGRTSDYVGELNTRHTFDNVVIEYRRFIPRTGSYLITASVDDQHILKFFADGGPAVKLPENSKVKITGYIKAQQISKWTNFKETMINRIKFATLEDTEQSSGWKQ